jgi:hypothetical protein
MLDTEDEPTIYHTLGGYARHSGLEPMIYHILGGYARHSGLEPTINHSRLVWHDKDSNPRSTTRGWFDMTRTPSHDQPRQAGSTWQGLQPTINHSRLVWHDRDSNPRSTTPGWFDMTGTPTHDEPLKASTLTVTSLMPFCLNWHIKYISQCCIKCILAWGVVKLTNLSGDWYTNPLYHGENKLVDKTMSFWTHRHLRNRPSPFLPNFLLFFKRK